MSGDPGATSRDDAILSGERHFWRESLFEAPKMSLARKYRIVPTCSPWVSEDGAFPKVEMLRTEYRSLLYRYTTACPTVDAAMVYMLSGLFVCRVHTHESCTWWDTSVPFLQITSLVGRPVRLARSISGTGSRQELS